MDASARRPRRRRAVWRAAAILAAQLPLCRTDSAEPSPPCGVEWGVGDDGGLQLAGWSLLSTFSLPAPEPTGSIRHHALPASGATPWESLAVTRWGPDEQGAAITATGERYTLTRNVSCDGDHLSLNDTLRLRGVEAVAVRSVHTLQPPAPLAATVLLGGVERTLFAGDDAKPWYNPTAVVSPRNNNSAGIALVAQDTLSRFHLNFTTLGGGGIRSTMDGIALSPAAPLRSAEALLFPLEEGEAYWGLINRLRELWSVNHPVPAFDFGPPASVFLTKGAVGPYLRRKHLTVAAPLAWLDYDNGYLPNNVTIAQQRSLYATSARQAMAQFRAADPALRVVGNLEGPSWSLTSAQTRILYDLLPADQRGPGYPKEATAAQTAVLRAHKEAWGLPLETMPLSAEGNPYYELYSRPDSNGRDTPLISLMSYPAAGNKQASEWLSRAEFLMDDATTDGVYIDGAGPVNALQRSCVSTNRWDGVTVVMDAHGHIAANCSDWKLEAVQPITALFELVLRKNQTMVANGWNVAKEHQGMPVLRFAETGGMLDPRTARDGVMPPVVPALMGGHLSTPLALSNIAVQGKITDADDYARFVMKDAMLHLRHGLMLAYYGTEIPPSGNGSYAALNAMLPITPVELHPGWIVGREKTVTAVSGRFVRPPGAKPSVACFGLLGTPSAPPEPARISAQAGGGWLVEVRLRDWAQFAVVSEGERKGRLKLDDDGRGGAPVIQWTSAGVRPGETLWVSGANLGGVSARLCHRNDECVQHSTPSSDFERWPTQLHLRVPESWTAGRYLLELSTGDNETVTAAVNAPQVAWWLADGIVGGTAPHSGRPGGWLRLHGSALAMDSGGCVSPTSPRTTKTQLRLRMSCSAEGSRELRAVTEDCFSVEFALPTSLASPDGE